MKLALVCPLDNRYIHRVLLPPRRPVAPRGEKLTFGNLHVGAMELAELRKGLFVLVRDCAEKVSGRLDPNERWERGRVGEEATGTLDRRFFGRAFGEVVGPRRGQRRDAVWLLVRARHQVAARTLTLSSRQTACRHPRRATGRDASRTAICWD